MTAKEFLNQISQLEKEITRKKQRCQTLRDVAMNTSVNNSNEAVQCTKEKNPLEKILTKVIDLDREIEKDEMALVDLKAEIWEQLDKLTDEIQKRILWLRYVERKPWRYIAMKVNFTSRYVHKLHIKALDELDEILRE